jgi:hypothetical protein
MNQVSGKPFRLPKADPSPAEGVIFQANDALGRDPPKIVSPQP